MDEPEVFHCIKWITEEKYENCSYLNDMENDKRFIDNNINYCNLVITNDAENNYVFGRTGENQTNTYGGE